VLEEQGEAAIGQGEFDYFGYAGDKNRLQSFSNEVGIASSSHCLLGRDCNGCEIIAFPMFLMRRTRSQLCLNTFV